jgi:hypothetical protein
MRTIADVGADARYDVRVVGFRRDGRSLPG